MRRTTHAKQQKKPTCRSVKNQQKHAKTAANRRKHKKTPTSTSTKTQSSQQSKITLEKRLVSNIVFVRSADDLFPHGPVAECDLLSGGNELFHVKVPSLTGRCLYDVKIEWIDDSTGNHDDCDPVGTIWYARQVPQQRHKKLIKKFDKKEELQSP